MPKGNVSSAQQQKSKLPQLDLFRSFALFGVISVHASSNAAAIDGIHSKYFPIFNTMNIMFKFGTPCFIFLSCFVLFYNYYERQDTGALIARFYRRRIMYILVPYVLISISYYLFNKGMNHTSWMGWEEEAARFMKKLSTGSAHTHLYFVFVNLQFYLLFPITLLLLQRLKRAAWLAVPIGLALQWGYVLLNHTYHFQWIPKGSLSVSYMSYYLLGACTAIYFDRLRGWLMSSWSSMRKLQRSATVCLLAGWLAVSGLHVMIWHMYRLYKTMFNTLLFELLWNVHTLLSAFVLLFAAFQLYRILAASMAVRALTIVGQLSFGVYLIHPAVLAIYRKTGGHISPFVSEYVMWIGGGFVSALLLSLLIVHSMFRYVPRSWLLYGSSPSYMAARTRRRSERPYVLDRSTLEGGSERRRADA